MSRNRSIKSVKLLIYVWFMERNCWEKSSTRTKVRLFNAWVKTVLLYECETLKRTNSLTQKLQVFVNRCLRNILNSKWYHKVTNEELWQRTRPIPEDETIKERNWKWVAMSFVIRLTMCQRKPLLGPDDRKSRLGRPKNTWHRALKEDLEHTENTWEWRRFVSALCSSAEIGHHK